MTPPRAKNFLGLRSLGMKRRIAARASGRRNDRHATAGLWRFVGHTWVDIRRRLYDAILPVPTVNFIPLAQIAESGDAPSHGGFAQTNLVFRRRALPIARCARGGVLTLRHQLNVLRRKAPKRVAFNTFDLFRSLSNRAGCSEHLGDRQAGDGHPLASGRVSLVLAMEVALSSRQTEGPARNPSVDPRHEPRQPALGRSADPRRTPQARHRCGSNLGRQIYGETQETPVAMVEDLPAQSRRRDCGNGSLCRSDAFLSAALWFADSLARPAPDPAAHPTAEWMARQLTEACGWEANPTYIVRDRDRVYGDIFPAGFVPRAFGTGQLRLAHPGKMGMRNG